MSGDPPPGPYGSINPQHMMGYMPHHQQTGAQQYPSAASPAQSANVNAAAITGTIHGRGGQQYNNQPVGVPQHEHVLQILKAYPKAGYENVYDVQLAGYPHPMQRTHTQLVTSAPQLLADFNARGQYGIPAAHQQYYSHAAPQQTYAPSSANLALYGREQPRRAAKSAVSSTAGADHDEDEEDIDAVGDAASYDDAESEDEEEEESASDFEDEFDADSPKKKFRKHKSSKKGTRQSSRAARQPQNYDFGSDANYYEDDFVSSASMSRRSSRDKRRTNYLEDGASSDGSFASADPYSRRSQPKSHGRSRMDEQWTYEELPLPEDDEAALDLQFRHRRFCSKCGLAPVPEAVAILQSKRTRRDGRPKKRKLKRDADLEEDSDQEIQRVEKMGAWMRCNVCIEAFHYNCMTGAARKEFSDMLKKEHADEFYKNNPPPPILPEEMILNEETGEMMAPERPIVEPPPREKVELDSRRTFTMAKCWSCKKAGGRRCFVCGISGRKIEKGMPGVEEAQTGEGPDATVPMAVDPVVAPTADVTVPAPVDGPAPVPAAIIAESTEAAADTSGIVPSLMFRCTKCKRAGHYTCMEMGGETLALQVDSYFVDGTCHDCYRWNVPLDVILAWAVDDSLPEIEKEIIDDDDVVEEIPVVQKKDESGKIHTIPSGKDAFARAKYLVKWQGESYRQLAWVPHAFLMAAYPAKLSNFLSKGSLVSFELPPVGDEPEEGEEERVVPVGSAPLPDPNARDRIPKSWSTVDRVLNVWYQSKKGPEHPAVEWRNYRKLPEDPEESIKLVMHCHMKWGDLPYGQATVEVPPKEDEEGYKDYVVAYKKFLAANMPHMKVPQISNKQIEELNRPRPKDQFIPVREQPAYVQSGTLMPFQLEGVNFMYYQWWNRQGCILADEMGLGKTVQIITFLSVLHHEQQARPFLVSVPNSTIGNWVREFEKWAPDMRVVPYSGDVESRRIIEDNELFDAQGVLKTHVVLATYEALEKNIHVFRAVQRWDCLVVDEGQRLKAGEGNALHDALQTLEIGHRILLSGTPLNNNIVELFNLLCFIDPEPGKWPDRDTIAAYYQELTPEKVEEIRGLLKPYFLRRTKDLVLNLPPLTEIVVPVSMTPLQRQIYRGILERNAAAIESIFQKAGGKADGYKAKARKTNFNNILMELRKTLCHPYTISPELEPMDVTPAQAQANLTEASAKFMLLASMLPKLKAAGHRVLIFSQFKLMLTLIENFLSGMRFKFLRLDGDTKQLDRQRGIDDFNAPDSDYFCYLLSTRAGGVGINLTTADTVIMYDQDFNPHQDIQAIARAHRIGQKKPVRVFKLLVKGTCEEKIFNAGNKKLGLDHLIIQRIDAKDESEDVESILQYGAKAIFDDKEAEANAIRYTDSEVDTLLARSAEPIPEGEKTAAGAFAHAKIWERSGKLEDVTVNEEEESKGGENMHGFWANILDQQAEAERQAKIFASINVGRGKRNRGSTIAYKTDSPARLGKRRKGADSDGSSGDEFMDMDRTAMSDEDSDEEFLLDPDEAPKGKRGRSAFDEPKRRRGGLINPFGGNTDALKKVRDQYRRELIEHLAIFARRYGDPDVDLMLEQAAKATSRLDQTLLVDDATKLIRRHYRTALENKAADGPEDDEPSGDKASSVDGASPQVDASALVTGPTSAAQPSSPVSTPAAMAKLDLDPPTKMETADEKPSTKEAVPVPAASVSAPNVVTPAPPPSAAAGSAPKLVQSQLSFGSSSSSADPKKEE